MKKKLLALTLVVVLAATAVIGGTLAYFTDDDSATNTFTVGKVDIDLSEESKNEDGFVAGEEKKDGGFKYDNILPGVKYSKSVDVTLEEGSVDSYVFVELAFTPANPLWDALPGTPDSDMLDQLLVNYNSILGGEINMVEQKYDEATDTYSEVYFLGVWKENDTMHLFDGVQLPASLTSEDCEKLTDSIDFSMKAYAIQEAGIEGGAVAAWNALKAEMTK